MPRRKSKKTTVRPTKFVKPEPFAQRHDRFAAFRWGESYTSLLLGIVVVIIAVLFGVSILRQTNHIKEITAIQTGPTASTAPSVSPTQEAIKPTNRNKTYTVESGDDLWSIAEKFYNSGYNWVDIASANNLSNPDDIFTGNELIIPSVAPKEATVAVLPSPQMPNAITGNTYTVQSGDSLWNVAVRAYGDGYRWTDLAKANNLSNPNVIFSGNVLQIPR